MGVLGDWVTARCGKQPYGATKEPRGLAEAAPSRTRAQGALQRPQQKLPVPNSIPVA